MSYYALTRRSLASSHHGVCQPVWLSLAAQNAPQQKVSLQLPQHQFPSVIIQTAKVTAKCLWI